MDRGNNISKQQCWALITRGYNVPKAIARAMLKEMEHLELLKSVDRFNYQIINTKKNRILRKMSSLYHELGFW